jgi:hypothetical protein
MAAKMFISVPMGGNTMGLRTTDLRITPALSLIVERNVENLKEEQLQGFHGF